MILGIDIGGSKTALVLVDGGTVVAREHTVYEKGVLGSFETWSTWMIQEVGVFLKKNNASPRAIGVSSAGVVRDGVIAISPNLPFLNETNIQKLIGEVISVPVVVENDANAFVWAEYKMGALTGSKNAIGLTVGTDIGGGFLIDGALYRGAHGAAGEVSFIAQGDKGTYGDRIAGKHFIKRYGSNPKALEDAAREGNERAITAYNTLGHDLGILIGNLVQVVDPERIVIGGGMAHAFDLFSDAMKKSAYDTIFFPQPREELAIVPAQLDRYASAIGAALLADV